MPIADVQPLAHSPWAEFRDVHIVNYSPSKRHHSRHVNPNMISPGAQIQKKAIPTVSMLNHNITLAEGFFREPAKVARRGGVTAPAPTVRLLPRLVMQVSMSRREIAVPGNVML